MFKVKSFEKNEISRVLEIYTQGLKAGKSTFNDTCPSLEDWDKGHLDIVRIGCYDNDKLVGFAALSPTSARACYKGVCEVSIYIDFAYHSKGLGTLLLKEAIKQSEENGIYSLYASIFSSNIASIKMCEKSGFRIVGTRERIAKDIFGAWQDTTIVEYRSKTVGV